MDKLDFLMFKYKNIIKYGGDDLCEDAALKEVTRITGLNFNELKDIPDDDDIKFGLKMMWRVISPMDYEKDSQWAWLYAFNTEYLDNHEYLASLLGIKQKAATKRLFKLKQNLSSDFNNRCINFSLKGS